MLKIRTTLSLLVLALSSLQMLNGMAPAGFENPESQRARLNFYITNQDLFADTTRYKTLRLTGESAALTSARLNLVDKPDDLDKEVAKFTSLSPFFGTEIVKQVLNEQKDINRETVAKFYAWRSEWQKAWASAVARASIKTGIKK